VSERAEMVAVDAAERAARFARAAAVAHGHAASAIIIARLRTGIRPASDYLQAATKAGAAALAFEAAADSFRVSAEAAAIAARTIMDEAVA
jgi:hypothetical protein